jgi:protease II
LDVSTFIQETIYNEIDPAFFVDISISKDNSFNFINVNSQDTSEVFYFQKKDKIKSVMGRERGLKYFVDCINVDIF